MSLLYSCRKTHKLACGMKGIRIEREFLEGDSPLIADRANHLGLSAVYRPRSHRACSVVVHLTTFFYVFWTVTNFDALVKSRHSGENRCPVFL